MSPSYYARKGVLNPRCEVFAAPIHFDTYKPGEVNAKPVDLLSKASAFSVHCPEVGPFFDNPAIWKNAHSVLATRPLANRLFARR